MARFFVFVFAVINILFIIGYFSYSSWRDRKTITKPTNEYRVRKKGDRFYPQRKYSRKRSFSKEKEIWENIGDFYCTIDAANEAIKKFADKDREEFIA